MNNKNPDEIAIKAQRIVSDYLTRQDELSRKIDEICDRINTKLRAADKQAKTNPETREKSNKGGNS
ncbi:hypothetical protein C7271_16730 [filamentous cyanobacterium CCP5]|nr:hypothetical protein C7271_16730 [filamentous cyanobacterium CCP5]